MRGCSMWIQVTGAYRARRWAVASVVSIRRCTEGGSQPFGRVRLCDLRAR